MPKNKKNSFLLPFLILSLILNFFSSLFFLNRQHSFPGDKVIDVLDGDTFVISGKQRVRLKRVQAPKLKYCYGKEAKQKLKELILGKEVFLTSIVTDRYGRLVALVYLDNTLINKLMLEQGFVSYLGGQTKEEKSLQLASDKAKKKKIGIYSLKCYPVKPPNSKCLIKGNINQKTNEKIYHFPGCSAYEQVKVERFRGDDWFCTEKQAQKKGFVKSKNCFQKKYSLQ